MDGVAQKRLHYVTFARTSFAGGLHGRRPTASLCPPLLFPGQVSSTFDDLRQIFLSSGICQMSINNIIAFNVAYSKRRRYCVVRRPSRCHAVCVSAALVSTAKVMRCILRSLVYVLLLITITITITARICTAPPIYGVGRQRFANRTTRVKIQYIKITRSSATA